MLPYRYWDSVRASRRGGPGLVRRNLKGETQMVKVVAIQDVIHTPGWKETSYGTRKCKSILNKQGMIEPLTVKDDSKAPYQLDGKNPWHDDYLQAAAHLGWDTVIVALDDGGFES
jgi:hypothetical protein